MTEGIAALFDAFFRWSKQNSETNSIRIWADGSGRVTQGILDQQTIFSFDSLAQGAEIIAAAILQPRVGDFVQLSSSLKYPITESYPLGNDRNVRFAEFASSHEVYGWLRASQLEYVTPGLWRIK